MFKLELFAQTSNAHKIAYIVVFLFNSFVGLTAYLGLVVKNAKGIESLPQTHIY